ncbi:PD-(D/E)XK nuclease family transposase [Pedobacter sp. MR2016-24]|uniref:PD-(D/E)XK nuclease family transposase n=1 Tax=Pedobacter sp. MR2016-24 TaxID=2994466 RepID=UPI003A4E4A93
MSIHSPISDFGFKKIFGNERSNEVLIIFLNELLKGKKKILKLSFIKDVQPEYPSDRSILIDLHCV